MARRDAQFELLTPRGPGGVAVVQVTGVDRWVALERMLGAGCGAPRPGGPPRLVLLQCGGVTLDQALLVERPDREAIELHLHGSPAVVAALEVQVGGFVATPLRRGEDLIRRAQSPAQLALGLEQSELDLAGALAVLDQGSPEGRRPALLRIHARSELALALSQVQRLVLCGAQNAGKSTLMNRLLFRERVLTGALPGMTRDPVAEAVLLGGYPYLVVDTAGEGEVDDEIDQRALAQARDARAQGLRLLVVDGSGQPSASDRAIRNRDTLVVRSKTDLPQATWPGDFTADLAVCCLGETCSSEVRHRVGAALRSFRDLPEPGPVGGVAALDQTELQMVLDRLRQA